MPDEIVAYSKTTGLPFTAVQAQYLESVGKGSLLRWVSTPTRVSQDINLALQEARKYDSRASISQDKYGNYFIKTYSDLAAENLAKQGVITNLIKETVKETPEIKTITTETTSYQPTISRFPTEFKPVTEKVPVEIVQSQYVKPEELSKLDKLHESLGLGAGLKERGIVTVAESPIFREGLAAGMRQSAEIKKWYETEVIGGIEKRSEALTVELSTKSPKSLEESTPGEIIATGVKKLATSAELGALGAIASVAYLPKTPEFATGVLGGTFIAGTKLGRGDIGGAYETIAAPVGVFVADVAKKPSFYAGMAIGGILTGEAVKGVMERRAVGKIAETTKADVLIDVTHRGTTTVVDTPITSIIKYGKEFKVAETRPYEFAGGKVITTIQAEIPRLIGKPTEIKGVGIGTVEVAYRQKPVAITEVLDMRDILNQKIIKRLVEPVAGSETTLTATTGKGYSTLTGIIKKTKKGILAGEKITREPLFVEEAGTKILALSKTAKDMTLTEALLTTKAGLKTKLAMLTKEFEKGYVSIGRAESELGAKIRVGELEAKGIPKYEITPIKRAPAPIDILKSMNKEEFGYKAPTKITVSEGLRELQKSYMKTAASEAKTLKEVNKITGTTVTKQIVKPIESQALKGLVQSISQQAVSDFISKEAKLVGKEAGTKAMIVSQATMALPSTLRPTGLIYDNGEVLVDFKTKFRVPEPQFGLIKTTSQSEQQILRQIQGDILVTETGVITDVAQAQIDVLTQTEEQILEIITEQVTEEITETQTAPPVLPPFVFTPTLPGIGIPIGVKSQPEYYPKYKKKRRTITTSKYKPSLAGIVYNLKSRVKPGVITGVEIRPYIVSGALKKKRKVHKKKTRRKRR